MLITSTYFFYNKTPRLRPANADLHTGSGITTRSRPLLSPQVHSKRNHQMSTTRYIPSGTPTSSFSCTNKCTMSGTTHTVRPYMYPSMVHRNTNHYLPKRMYHQPTLHVLLYQWSLVGTPVGTTYPTCL